LQGTPQASSAAFLVNIFKAAFLSIFKQSLTSPELAEIHILFLAAQRHQPCGVLQYSA